MIREHVIDIRVRYSETDSMGVVHHGNYASYFEMGRIELYRAQGGDYRQTEQRGFYLVISRLDCRYHAPARYDDLLTLTTRVKRVTPARLEHEYELKRDDEVIATAHSVLACVDAEGRIQRIGDAMPDVACFDAAE